MLEWTPGPGDVGGHDLKIKLSAGSLERIQEVQLRVAQDEIALTVASQLIAASGDGTAVVTLSSNGRQGGDGAAKSSQIMVLDLKNRAIVARRELGAAATAIAADSKYVFVGLRDSDAFYILSRKDLSDVKRLFTKARVTGFTSVCDGRLLAHTATGTTAIDTEKFQEIKELSCQEDRPQEPEFWMHERMAPSPAPQRMGDGWLFDGIVYDGSLQKARALVAPAGIARVGSENPQPEHWHPMMDGRQMQEAPCAPWGVYVRQGSLLRTGGQQVARIDAAASMPTVILPTAPAIATLNYKAKYQQNNNSARAEIVLRDLLTGTVQQTLVLFDGPIPQPQGGEGDYYGGAQVLHLLATPTHLIAHCYDKLYVLPNPVLPEDKFPIPLHFLPDQGVTVLDPAKPTTHTFRLRGAQDVDLSLTREVRGVDLDKAKNAVILTPEPLLEMAAAKLAQMEQSASLPGGKGLAAYLPAAQAKFKMITERQAAGIPAYMVVSVSARDKSLQVATWQQAVLLDVPSEMVQRRLAAGADASTRPSRTIAAMGGPSTRRYEPSSRPAPTSVVEASDERIERLEERISELEQRIDMLINVLQSRR